LTSLQRRIISPIAGQVDGVRRETGFARNGAKSLPDPTSLPGTVDEDGVKWRSCRELSI
jgi:hypothetical protein